MKRMFLIVAILLPAATLPVYTSSAKPAGPWAGAGCCEAPATLSTNR